MNIDLSQASRIALGTAEMYRFNMGDAFWQKVIKLPEGGTITYANIEGIDYRIHTFLGNDEFKTYKSMDLEYFVVGEGGTGAANKTTFPRGGGAGGDVVHNLGSPINMTAKTYGIIVGSGTTGNQKTGQNSAFDNITTAYGGGGAGTGGAGGSNSLWSGGQGSIITDGSVSGGGGAGAGGNGTNGEDWTGAVTTGAPGGPGIFANPDGNPRYFGVGGNGNGGGFVATQAPDLEAGSGAGSPGRKISGSLTAVPPGSGCVIVRYPAEDAPVFEKKMGLAIPANKLRYNHDWLSNMHQMKVPYIRFDAYWDQIQAVIDGPYDWSFLDKIINKMLSMNVKPLLILTGKPAWGSTAMTDTADHDRFAVFAAAAATHFKDRIFDYEIWNEPNLTAMTPTIYTSILQKTYTALKAVDSRITVISAGLANVPADVTGKTSTTTWMDQSYAAGISGYYDAFGFHPYTWPYWISDVESFTGWNQMINVVRAKMVANGESNKKVWITEFGYPSNGTDKEWQTEPNQKDVLDEFIAEYQNLSWVGPVFWYSFKDNGIDPDENEDWFGLYRYDETHKPALPTMLTHWGGTLPDDLYLHYGTSVGEIDLDLRYDLSLLVDVDANNKILQNSNRANLSQSITSVEVNAPTLDSGYANFGSSIRVDIPPGHSMFNSHILIDMIPTTTGVTNNQSIIRERAGGSGPSLFLKELSSTSYEVNFYAAQHGNINYVVQRDMNLHVILEARFSGTKVWMYINGNMIAETDLNVAALGSFNLQYLGHAYASASFLGKIRRIVKVKCDAANYDENNLEPAVLLARDKMFKDKG